MNEETEKQKIRQVILDWMEASRANDLERVLQLMAEDVVFLVPGRPPMRGRAAFAEASRAMAGKVLFDGRAEIQEIEIAGSYAFCWNYLSLSVTPLPAGETMQRAGHILSVFRKQSDGRWVLYRDANLLTSVPHDESVRVSP